MKGLRNQKGITLVALVVTIIILLILASVSLSLISGSRGIMTRATNAVNTNESATAAEQAELKIAEIQTDYYEGYYVSGDINKTMTKYIEENGNTKCANERYYMTVEGGTVSVYVGGDATTGTRVASRDYNASDNYFTWKDDQWTYYSGR